jgi:uncharacterized protein YpmB
MDGDKKSNGALLGSVVIIVILVIAGIYLFKKASVSPVAPATTADVSDILAPTDMTSPTKIEGDLDNIDLDSLDADL